MFVIIIVFFTRIKMLSFQQKKGEKTANETFSFIIHFIFPRLPALPHTYAHAYRHWYACIFLALSHAYALSKNVYAFSTNKSVGGGREREETVTEQTSAQSVSLCVFVALLLSQSMRHTHTHVCTNACASSQLYCG